MKNKHGKVPVGLFGSYHLRVLNKVCIKLFAEPLGYFARQI